MSVVGLPATLTAESRLLADFVAFTALPATWVGAPPGRVAENLADCLHRALPTRATGVVLRDDRGDVTTVMRGEDEAIERALQAARDGDADATGEGIVHVGIGPLGARGALLARGLDAAFPNAHERLLFVVAANMADTALREAAVDHQVASIQLQLARLEKLSALGQIATGVGHEIRTPLTYATNNLYLALHALQKVEPAQAPLARKIEGHLQEVEQALERINAIVQEMRRFHAPVARRERRRLAEVVEQGVRLFRATHVGRSVVVTRLGGDALVEVDPFQIQQVVLNLLQNSHEAMPRGGQITVRTTDGAGHALLTVEDDGPGIPGALLPYVFDPFLTTKPEGSGLGLPIVRRIVEAHHGAIHVESAPGRGTRFEITLPFAPSARPAIHSSSESV